MGRKMRCIAARWPLKLHSRRPWQWASSRAGFFFVKIGLSRFLLTSKPYSGMCVTARWRRYPDGREHPPADVVTEFPSMAIKKRESKAKDIKHLAPVESQVFEGLLSLVEHMCMMQYEDGSPRVPGWITVKSQGAAWAVQIKDPDSCSSFTAVGATLDAALETAALLLSCDDAPWEADKWLAESQRRSMKK